MEEPTKESVAKDLKRIEKKLDHGHFTRKELQSWLQMVSAAQTLAASCIADSETAVQTLEENLASIGEPVKGEPSDVARKRREVQKQKTDLEKQIAQCRVITIHGDELADIISDRGKALLAEELFARGPHTFSLILLQAREPTNWIDGFEQFITEQSGFNLFGPTEWSIGVLAVLLTLALAGKLKRRLSAWADDHDWQAEFSERFVHALVRTFAHYLRPILGTTIAAALLYIATRELDPTPFISLLAYGLAILYGSIAVIRLITVPVPPSECFLPLTPEIARGLGRRLPVLALLALIGYLGFYTDFSESLPAISLTLARDIYSLLVVLNIVWALWLIFRSPKLVEIRWIIGAVLVLVLVSVVVEWFGYRNLALIGRRAVIGTLLAFVVVLLAGQLFRGLFNAVEEGKYPWTHRIRKVFAAGTEGAVSGLVWFRLIVTVAIWVAFGLVTLHIWDISDEVIAEIHSYMLIGFDIGSLHLTPVRLLWAGVTFAISLMVVGWLRSRLENRWLVMTGMERGAREALVTISGYVLTTIAALIALSVAGVDFSNLAIIAGALSVGIGFGLQNVVNNFVSGLILLFERPIKTGDWISVGGTEGYVKRIRIRATQIQTFDRSDVIVPNSELISNQVTNWMLQDVRGRAIIAVGVAYGSDTEKVRDVLLKVAEDHPRVAKDSYSPAPRVLFREFGDSSLNFELRVFCYNVDERLTISSDLHFAIDKAFREEGIEIPFPQRDVHVRDLPSGQTELPGNPE